MIELTPPELPSWLPPAVATAAMFEYANTASEDQTGRAVDLWGRLTTDPRMDLVWKELYKKRRVSHLRTDEFRYSRFEVLKSEGTLLKWMPNPPAEPQSAQDGAVSYFFHCIYQYALNEPPRISLSEIEDVLSTRRTAETLLREAAEKLSAIGMEEYAEEVERIASDCEQHGYWAEPDVDDPQIVQRDRGDPRLRTYVRSIAQSSRELFGHPLYGTLATITNVAFGGATMTEFKNPRDAAKTT